MRHSRHTMYSPQRTIKHAPSTTGVSACRELRVMDRASRAKSLTAGYFRRSRYSLGISGMAPFWVQTKAETSTASL